MLELFKKKQKKMSHVAMNFPQRYQSEMTRRHAMVTPGHLVHSVQMDQEKLECFHRWGCCMCIGDAAKTLASRTIIDVYTNGMMTNAPMGVPNTCCIWCDRPSFMMWDDKRIGAMGVAGCCTPILANCPCPHGCGICGDVF